MPDALDPRTDWVHEAARAPTENIGLSKVPSRQISEVVQLFEGPKDSEASYFLDPDKTGPLLKSNPFVAYLVVNQNAYPIRSILKSLMRQGVISGLQESPYFDLEFWHTHAGFYDEGFRQHARHCERFHFFRFGDDLKPAGLDTALEDELLGLLIDQFVQGRTWASIQDEFKQRGGVRYLGHLVLRPTLSFSVGRAAIAFDQRLEAALCHIMGIPVEKVRERLGSLKEEFGALPILKTSHLCAANLLATRMEIENHRFHAAGPQPRRCTTVSLWIATHAMADKFGLNRFNYATITRQALGEWSSEARKRNF